jgi:hypothetical protein
MSITVPGYVRTAAVLLFIGTGVLAVIDHF